MPEPPDALEQAIPERRGYEEEKRTEHVYKM